MSKIKATENFYNYDSTQLGLFSCEGKLESLGTRLRTIFTEDEKYETSTGEYMFLGLE